MLLSVLLVASLLSASEAKCRPTISRVSGKNVPSGPLCSGQLLLNEQFNYLNKNLWKHEITIGGGGNNEFQWYTPDSENSYIEKGKLYIRPTLTKDKIGEYNLMHGKIKLDHCTSYAKDGCERQATPDHIINPIRSARLRTIDNFSFRYGKVEVVAKMPAGDWLWPAIWMLPSKYKYGEWPRSGEIDILESRGNRAYYANGKHIGVEHMGSTLHFGPRWDQNGFRTATYSKNTQPGRGFNKNFHKYRMEWTNKHLKFKVDDQEIGTVIVGEGFWKRGRFHGNNIWSKGTIAAPFDEDFHFVINLAVGGTNSFFPEEGNRNGKKPWKNSEPYKAMTDFWNGRKQWSSGWKLNENHSKEASLVIDSIKVWAI